MPRITTWNFAYPIDKFRDLLLIRPYTGSMGKDIFYLLFLSAIHYTVLPSIIGRYLLIDLITPWLVITMVVAPLGRGLVLVLLGALMMETRSTVPAGLYITCFWMTATAIALSRESLSWRHYFPWVVTLTIAQFWTIVFELFVNSVILNRFSFTFQDFFIQSIRLLVAIGFGMVLCRRFRSSELPMGTF